MWVGCGMRRRCNLVQTNRQATCGPRHGPHPCPCCTPQAGSTVPRTALRVDHPTRHPMRLFEPITPDASRRRAKMAPNLSATQHDLLRGMLLETTISDADIAATVECSERSVRSARSNLLLFGSTRAPSNGGGRPAKITPPMKAALQEQLLEKPTLYQEEMVAFLKEKFGVQVARSSVGQVLNSMGWSKKNARHVAQE